MKNALIGLGLALALATHLTEAQTPAGALLQEVPWPQSFDLQALQVRSYGFAVTQPGTLIVSVQAQGAPVSVAVRGPLPNPLPEPAPQTAAGSVRFTYNLTPQDIQRGLFWQIDVRLAQPAAVQAGARASGTIGLLRPPVDAALVQRAVQALMAQRRLPTAQQQAQAAAQAKARLDAAFMARRTQLAQHLEQRRAAVMAQLAPTIDALRRRKAGLAPAVATSPASGQLGTRGLAPVQRFPLAPAPPPTIKGVTIANNQDTIPLPPGSYGQPGDEVTLTGSGFTNTDGEVHFVIGPLPSQDIVASNPVWVDQQIVAPVPVVAGVLPYAGAIYVKRLPDGAKSLPIPFRFEPNVEQREIRALSDYVLQQLGGVDLSTTATTISRLNNNFFSGASGVDRLFVSTRLKNGWQVVGQPEPYGGSVFVAPVVWPTDNLSLFVGFSMGPEITMTGSVEYGIAIPIQGPAGVPDGVVCPTLPANGSCPATDSP
jgi:hypothetical protein